MAKTNRMQIKPNEVINKIIDQAKAMTVRQSQMGGQEVQQEAQSTAAVEEMISLLKEQESFLEKLSQTVANNDQKINGVHVQLEQQKSVFDRVAETIDQQESILANQVDSLKEDNRACVTQLKDMMTQNQSFDYDAMEVAFKDTSEALMDQQRSHTVEMDRMLMSIKTSLEKNIEKTKGVLEKKIDLNANQGRSVRSTTLIISIVNLLCLIGYIVYDILLK